MVRKIAIVFLTISIFALLGVGYLQFTNDSTYVLAQNIPRYHKITAEDITEQRIARLRDEKLKALIITNPGQIVGKYAGREMKAGEIFVNNDTLLKELPRGRCFSSGRCLEEGQGLRGRRRHRPGLRLRRRPGLRRHRHRPDQGAQPRDRRGEHRAERARCGPRPRLRSDHRHHRLAPGGVPRPVPARWWRSVKACRPLRRFMPRRTPTA